MKHFVTILFILLGHLVFGQTSSDTCLSKKDLHDLKYKIYSLIDKNKIQEFQIRLQTELKQIDTIKNTKDTIIINYISKTGAIIRVETKCLDLNPRHISTLWLLITTNKDC